MTKYESQERVMYRLAHAIIDGSDSQEFSDLKEDLKCACAKLKIPYDSRTTGAALESALYNRSRGRFH